MRLTLPTSSLLDAVGLASAVAAAKSPKRILECVALRAAADGSIRIEASDLDVSLQTTLAGGRVEEPGVVAIPAQRLASVLRDVGEGRAEITLVGAEQTLQIDTADCHFRILGEDPAELHPADEFPQGGHVVVPFGALRRMIDRTQFATAREPGRFALHGVQFRFLPAELEVVATDGRRLARCVQALAEGPATELKVIVGTKPLAFLARLSGDDATPVHVAVADRRIYFRTGNSLLSSRLVDGGFPPYEQVIPPPSNRYFETKVLDLATALRRAALLTTKELRSVAIGVEPGRLTFSSRSPQVGEAKVELAVPYEGEPERLGFNPDFLLDALRVMDPTATVRFEFTSTRAPGKLTDGAAYVYVVSPVSVTE